MGVGVSRNGNGKNDHDQAAAPPYLEVKNWDRYQVVKDGRVGARWLKLYKAILTDRQISEWSNFRLGVWIRVLCLRLELARNLDNDLLWIAHQICRGPEDTRQVAAGGV